MKKRRSLVKKQMILYFGVLIFTFACFGLSLVHIYAQRYVNEQEQQFILQGERFKESMNSLYYTGVVDTSRVNFELQIIERYMGASVFFMNKDGKISMVSPGIDEEWIGKTITDEAVNIVMSGNVATVKGKVGGMFDDVALTVGYPITLGGKLVGGIFMCKSVSVIKDAASDMSVMVFGLTIPAIIIGFLLIYFFTRTIVKPLLDMKDAAKIIADGNFDKRIEYSANDEIDQLAESFNNMAESLEENEKTQREFIANISHDLRSPLTSIQGFIGAIADGTIPPEKQQRYFNIIQEETGRLTKLANDMLDLSRAEAGATVIEKCDFDINDLIRDSLDSMEPRLKKKNIETKAVFVDEVTEVNADPNKIQRVIQNLLDNAIKFTPDGGEIKVETTLKGNKVLVSVKDSGIGIKEDEKRKVFERFFKADSSRGLDKTGVGLGLSIVKEFIKAHGETIEVKSEEGKGTEFIFTLEKSKE